jgi:hypothetical protein
VRCSVARRRQRIDTKEEVIKMANQDRSGYGKVATWAAAALGLVGLVAGAFRIGLQRLLWIGTCAVGAVGLWSTYA